VVKMQEQLVLAQIVGGTTVIEGESTNVVMRASKYMDKSQNVFFRVSCVRDSAPIDFEDKIQSVDTCKKLFEDLQVKYFGEVKQRLKMQEFI
jgi:hypothetical protein